MPTPDVSLDTAGRFVVLTPLTTRLTPRRAAGRKIWTDTRWSKDPTRG